MSQFISKLIILMLGTLGHHNVRVTIYQYEPVQHKCPLVWPTSILKDLSAILQEFLPIIFSCVLVNKCDKFVSSIFILIVKLDLCSIYRCPGHLSNVIIHLWVVLLEIRFSMEVSHYCILIHRTMLFIS